MATRKKTIDPGPSCQHCKHYQPYVHDGMEQGWGYCRRYPPVMHMIDGDEGPEPLSLFPQVEPVDVCGEIAFKQ